MKKTIIALSLVYVMAGPVLAHDDKSGDGHEHAHAHSAIEVSADHAPRVTEVKVLKDPVGGYNLFVSTENFEFAPDLVNLVHADGKGHAHIYVDGVKIARIYGPAYHIETLTPGERKIEVTLNANDHREFAVNGTKIAGVTTFLAQ